MNKKYKNYIVFIVLAIVILMIAGVVIMNSLKEENKKNMIEKNTISNVTSDTNIQNYIKANNVNESSIVIEDGVAKLDENTYIELETPYNEDSNNIEEVQETTTDYQFATYFVTKYLRYLASGDGQGALALNPQGTTRVSINSNSKAQIRHVLAGGYTYNKTYYVQAKIDSNDYYFVCMFDMNNKTFQVIETDSTEYENAVNNKMKEDYNRQYIIEKNDYNGYDDLELR